MANTVLANLIVKVGADTKAVRRGLGSVSKRLKAVGRDALTVRNAMGVMAGAAGFAFATKKVFDLGAAVEETGSKFRTVFGESTREVQGFIDEFGTIAGLSNEQAQGVLATTGAIVQGMGFAQAASAEFATEVTKLSGDLSSFNNIPIEETSLAIQSALTGERESLKRLGVVILETDVQQRALITTGKSSAKALTQQEKATATLALITERAGVAIGDLERTQGSSANRARRLGAEFQNIKETLASALLPAIDVLVGSLESVLGGSVTLTEWLKTSGPIFAAWAEVGVAAFGVVAESVRAATTVTLAFGRQFVATAGAMVAFIARDWQTFHTLADEIEQSWVDMGGGFDAVGDGMLRLYDRIREAMVTFGSTTVGIVLPSLGGFAGGMDAAATATDRLTDALHKLNAATSLLGGLARIGGLGFLGSIAGPLGIAAGILGPGKTLFGGGKAAGGPVSGGTAYMVGEKGPELFVPGSAGTIVPNGGGGTTLVQIVTQDGRALTDKIDVTQRRDSNLRRVMRVPVAAMAL